MNTAFNSIKKGLTEAIDFAEGKPVDSKIYKPKTVNVKDIRKNVGMSQKEFASTFGISLGTLRHWERGDRKPRGPALVLLNLVKKEPDTILKVLLKTSMNKQL